MNALQRWFLRRVTRHAGRYLRAQGLLRTVKQHPALVWEPGSGRVLVLAPHMDDEVIGCGGTLALHALRGAEITVVFVADGRSGSKGLQVLSGPERTRRERELVLVRKAEARRALAALGAADPVFLDAADWNVAPTPALCAALRRILDERRPELVYVPWFLEEHPDHRATGEILLAATGADDRFDCCAYEVWTPLFPNCLVDIGETADVKRRALEQYQSQLADNDYLHAALGLNAYRAMLLSRNAPGYAEAFVRVPLAEYRRLAGAHADRR